MENSSFSHIDKHGAASMVDISDKALQQRTAIAEGFISLQAATLSLIHENLLKKGDVLSTARIAGIQAAKKTADLIPLCHALLTEKISIEFIANDSGIAVKSTVRCTGKTGVEMEALTAVSIALLTIYDMCKAVDKLMVISDIRLVDKIKI